MGQPAAGDGSYEGRARSGGVGDGGRRGLHHRGLYRLVRKRKHLSSCVPDASTLPHAHVWRCTAPRVLAPAAFLGASPYYLQLGDPMRARNHRVSPGLHVSLNRVAPTGAAMAATLAPALAASLLPLVQPSCGGLWLTPSFMQCR